MLSWLVFDGCVEANCWQRPGTALARKRSAETYPARLKTGCTLRYNYRLTLTRPISSQFLKDFHDPSKRNRCAARHACR